jgi:hypothetical protein
VQHLQRHAVNSTCNVAVQLPLLLRQLHKQHMLQASAE